MGSEFNIEVYRKQVLKSLLKNTMLRLVILLCTHPHVFRSSNVHFIYNVVIFNTLSPRIDWSVDASYILGYDVQKSGILFM